jgi:glucose/arabinose dehydrogenase
LKDPAQDLGSPLGKILRVDKGDGSAAPDNPFVDVPGADPRVFAYGLRNPYDFSFHPQSGQIYEAENGPSNCDEINIIMPGENYGHPMSYSDAEEPPCLERPGATPIYLPHRPGMRPEVFGSNVAPTGIHFVSGDVYPSIGDALLYCEWNTGFMRRLVLAGPGQDRVVDDSIVVEDCHLDITTDSEGIVYYSSFWEIRRLVPSSEEGQ